MTATDASGEFDKADPAGVLAADMEWIAENHVHSMSCPESCVACFAKASLLRSDKVYGRRADAPTDVSADTCPTCGGPARQFFDQGHGDRWAATEAPADHLLSAVDLLDQACVGEVCTCGGTMHNPCWLCSVRALFKRAELDAEHSLDVTGREDMMPEAPYTGDPETDISRGWAEPGVRDSRPYPPTAHTESQPRTSYEVNLRKTHAAMHSHNGYCAVCFLLAELDLERRSVGSAGSEHTGSVLAELERRGEIAVVGWWCEDKHYLSTKAVHPHITCCRAVFYRPASPSNSTAHGESS